MNITIKPIFGLDCAQFQFFFCFLLIHSLKSSRSIETNDSNSFWCPTEFNFKNEHWTIFHGKKIQRQLNFWRIQLNKKSSWNILLFQLTTIIDARGYAILNWKSWGSHSTIHSTYEHTQQNYDVVFFVNVASKECIKGCFDRFFLF